MIRIVKEITFKDLDNDSFFRKLPFIAGTAAAEIKLDQTEHGLLRTLSLSATITHPLPGLEGNLQLRLVFENGDRESFGTSDLPARLNFSRGDVTRISASYSVPSAL